MKLSNRIRQIRVLKGYSQEFVADKLEISQPAYSKIENKAENSSFTTIEKIARILDVDIGYLIDINNPIE